MSDAEGTSSADEQALILDTIDRFLAREVVPVVRDLESRDAYPAELADRMAELGLFGAILPREWGGLGLSASTYARIVEHISQVWMSLTGIINSHLMMALAIERFGSDALKRRYLPACAAGELRGGLALTEPGAGTDLQGIRTRATRDGDSYVLDGIKTWITNAVRGQLLAVLVKTDADAEPAHRGMSLLIVEQAMGYKTSKLAKLGYRGVDTGEVQLTGVRVPVANRVGPEGRGLQQVLSGLELGRVNVAARGVGLARACLNESLAYAQQRKTFGVPIAEHQAIQLKLADMAVRVQSAEALTLAAAEAFDRGERCDLEAGMAKLVASEAAMENAAEAMRIHGAYGYSPEYNIERYYRDAPLLVIGEGTNELQRLIIARQLVSRHPA